MDPQSLRRAAAPGRLRGIAVELLTSALADRDHAGSVLRHGLRDARALHSWERRVAADGLRAIPRLEARLVAALGVDEPLALWLGWLVSEGLDAAEIDAPWPLHRAADLDATLRDLDPDAALARRASVPAPIAASLRRAFGDDAERFIDASAERAPVVLRLRRARASEVAARVGGEPSPLTPHGLRLPAGTHLPDLALSPSAYEVQDDGSQLVALCVPRGRVLDRCAGAGGKALHLADLGAVVTATDLRAPALHELRRRAARAGARVRVLMPGDDADGGYDAVLVDAPCSGSGTWRRHPELRWRLHHLPHVRQQQQALLDDAAARVRPGGVIVYATCSVLPDEDEDAVEAFLARTPGFALDPITEAPAAVRRGPFVRTSPHEHGADGFFVARLRRTDDGRAGRP